MTRRRLTSADLRFSWRPSISFNAELGVLVWQDFQFACGVYPAFHSFVQSVKAEAEDNVRRLRHHPSLALFCGNNEGKLCPFLSKSCTTPTQSRLDYQMVLQWGGAHACRSPRPERNSD